MEKSPQLPSQTSSSNTKRTKSPAAHHQEPSSTAKDQIENKGAHPKAKSEKKKTKKTRKEEEPADEASRPLEVKKPKPPRNAYIIWSQHFREQNKELFDQIRYDKHYEVLGEKWKETSNEVKAYYKKLETSEKLQYFMAMKLFYSTRPIRRLVGNKLRKAVKRPTSPFCSVMKETGATMKFMSETGTIKSTELLKESAKKWNKMSEEEKTQYRKKYLLKYEEYRKTKNEKMKGLLLKDKEPKSKAEKDQLAKNLRAQARVLEAVARAPELAPKPQLARFEHQIQKKGRFEEPSLKEKPPLLSSFLAEEAGGNTEGGIRPFFDPTSPQHRPGTPSHLLVQQPLRNINALLGLFSNPGLLQSLPPSIASYPEDNLIFRGDDNINAPYQRH